MRRLLESTPRAIERWARERPDAPLLLPLADSADLPSASAYPNAIMACPDLGAPVFSDGTDWFPITLGIAL